MTKSDTEFHYPSSPTIHHGEREGKNFFSKSKRIFFLPSFMFKKKSSFFLPPPRLHHRLSLHSVRSAAPHRCRRLSLASLLSASSGFAVGFIILLVVFVVFISVVFVVVISDGGGAGDVDLEEIWFFFF